MKRILSSLIALGFAFQSASAITVVFGTGTESSWFTDSTGMALADGSLVQVGTFTGGFEAANFTLFAEVATSTWPVFPPIGTQTGRVAGGEISNSENDSLFNNKQIYLMVFNAPTANEATQYGIFTSSLDGWKYSDLFASTIDVTEIDTVINGYGTINHPTVGLYAPIPEPATAGFLAGAAMLGLVALRRRQA